MFPARADDPVWKNFAVRFRHKMEGARVVGERLKATTRLLIQAHSLSFPKIRNRGLLKAEWVDPRLQLREMTDEGFSSRRTLLQNSLNIGTFLRKKCQIARRKVREVAKYIRKFGASRIKVPDPCPNPKNWSPLDEAQSILADFMSPEYKRTIIRVKLSGEKMRILYQGDERQTRSRDDRYSLQKHGAGQLSRGL